MLNTVPGVWRPRRPQGGASLIEVLVSILIVSLGVMATAGLLAKSSQLAKASEFRAMAAQLAADMADRLKANAGTADAAAAGGAGGALNGDYNLTPAALLTKPPDAAAKACTDPAAACSRTEMAAYDLAQWGRVLYHSMPGGTAYIQFDAADGNAVDLWVAWEDPNALSATKLGLTDVAKSACPADFQALDPLPGCLYLRVGL